MIWNTKFIKRLILFLDTSLNHTANYKQIKNTFPNEIDVDKIIEDALNKNWIVKTSKNQYILTKIGENQIQKMTKNQKNEISVDFKVLKIVRCSNCMGTFPTKGTSSWCSQCRSRQVSKVNTNKILD